ncbi:unnamed protein product [Plutella xylostella]|uniref:(diamondback moth) hypothetical protein n=1 Tax=Plutella xylostella TaxID=51655 RepID=A0A8S4FZ04_PLUXY|nr:unnamed protein product [Plutella xylostella]
MNARPRASRLTDAAGMLPWWGCVREDQGRWWSDSGPDSERQVVYLPALLPREAQSASGRQEDVPFKYQFDAFGRSFDLQLVPNRRLLSPHFRVWGSEGAETADDAPACHYLHAGPGAVAALSACRSHALHGLIVVDNSTYEVRPLDAGMGRSEEGGRTPHVIRRAPPPRFTRDDTRPLRPRPRRPRNSKHKPGPPNYTIEIALFVDEAAYKIFNPYFNYNEADLRDMLLAYINGVQALYHHESLGTRIQLSLVRLTLLRTQPASLTANAERGRLLDSFCAYQRSLNVDDDEDPEHWDMALLLSGLDFYSEENGRRNGVTMGLAPVGGVCLPAHACVVAELGAADALGRPYPSAGFTSVYILAHEIGHNLGMHHDGTGNGCARDGYIMSPSRGTRGEAAWSPCSKRLVAELEWATCLLDGGDDLDTPPELQHERFGDAPGNVWNAKKQCEVNKISIANTTIIIMSSKPNFDHGGQSHLRSAIYAGVDYSAQFLLRDVDASPTPPAPSPEHCEQLACRSPHRAGFYYAGPALPGTPCGPAMVG